MCRCLLAGCGRAAGNKLANYVALLCYLVKVAIFEGPEILCAIRYNKESLLAVVVFEGSHCHIEVVLVAVCEIISDDSDTTSVKFAVGESDNCGIHCVTGVEDPAVCEFRTDIATH